MGKDKIDKASALYLMVELASHMTTQEIFRCLVDIGNTVSDRYDLAKETELKAKYPSLAACFRDCLK